MKQKLILLLFLISALTTIAQTDTTTKAKKSKPYMASINTMDGRKTTGLFYKMNDDSVYLIPAANIRMQRSHYKFPDAKQRTNGIEALQINTITLKKSNAGLKGALIGLGTGAAIGAIVGFSFGDDEQHGLFSTTAEEKAAGLAVMGGLTGAVVGGIIGTLAKMKFTIGGKKETYRDLSSELMQWVIIK